MPFTRLSLRLGHTDAYLRAVADSLDRALVDAFDVPPDDRFLIIHQHRPEEWIFDRHYRGGPRSDDAMLFHITTGRVRQDAIKRGFYRCLTDRLAAAPGVRPEDVMVVISDTTFENWSFGSGISAAEPEATP